MTCKPWWVLPLLISLPAQADSWSFSKKIAVSKNAGAGVFQHLDAAGRKSIAVSGKAVAVVWEDNRNGMPQAYVALKNLGVDEFSQERPISTGKSAYAPAIVALGAERFLVGWEQDDAVWLRTVSASGLGPAVPISRSQAGQVALAAIDGRDVFAAWSQRTGRFARIVTATIKTNDQDEAVRVGATEPVDPKPPVDDQLSPTIVVTKKGTTVAWEDRRGGHTVLLYSHAARGKPFSTPKPLNEVVQKSELYGRGSGVTRVALSALDNDRIGATWMDKRGYQTGYDIYAAFSQDDGAHFGANELVQDAFADQYAQWHPAMASDTSGLVIVAWDDDRDSTSSIWMAWKTRDGWSVNLSPPPASGDNRQQTNPAIALDTQGNLHLIWLEQETENSPGRVMYAMGHYQRDSQPTTAPTRTPAESVK